MRGSARIKEGFIINQSDSERSRDFYDLKAVGTCSVSSREGEDEWRHWPCQLQPTPSLPARLPFAAARRREGKPSEVADDD